MRRVSEMSNRSAGPSGVAGWRRPVVGVTGACVLVVAACASGSDSSFTSLADAEAQAVEWVDSAVTEAIPGASTADGNREGPDSCTTSADFSQYSYSLSVDVPPDRVDEYTAAVWASLRDNGFGAGTTSGGAPVGTVPAPPGPGSPSWTLMLFHDGFKVEITGARTAPTYVSTYIITPCLKTT